MIYIYCLIALGVIFLLFFLFWRYVWFFRNPRRDPSHEEGILSPADGKVVYVRKAGPHEPVISIKRGTKASINDIAREDMKEAKIVIGVFMSPFNVHYNRAPISGTIAFVHHHPPKDQNQYMTYMHFRTLFRLRPYYKNSRHVISNERTVTRIDGIHNREELHCYVVQIAGKSVHGIESYFDPKDHIQRGTVFGMIRIGSQVDLIIPWKQGMEIMISPGQRVQAGKTILIK